MPAPVPPDLRRFFPEDGDGKADDQNSAELLAWDVLVWRHDELVRAGYPVLVALRLAESREVDLHQACELLQNGCPVTRAVEILL